VLNLTGRLHLPKPEIWQMLLSCQQNLKVLVLETCNLDELPPQVASLENLRELFLGNNRLKLLPDELGQCRRLRKLYFGNNKVREIPASLASLLDLKELDAALNEINEIPIFLMRLKLEKFFIARNPIRSPILPAKIMAKETTKEEEGRAVLRYCQELLAANGESAWVLVKAEKEVKKDEKNWKKKDDKKSKK